MSAAMHSQQPPAYPLKFTTLAWDSPNGSGKHWLHYFGPENKTPTTRDVCFGVENFGR